MKTSSSKYRPGSLIPGKFLIVMTNVTSVEILSTEKDFSVLLININVKIATDLVILVACATRSKNLTRRGLDHPKDISSKWVQFICKKNSICSKLSDNTSSDVSFCLQMMLQTKQANTNYPTPQHLFTNLKFKVKPHKNKTKFL